MEDMRGSLAPAIPTSHQSHARWKRNTMFEPTSGGVRINGDDGAPAGKVGEAQMHVQVQVGKPSTRRPVAEYSSYTQRIQSMVCPSVVSWRETL